MKLRRRAVASLTALALGAAFAQCVHTTRADILLTREGVTHEGRITISNTDGIQVAASNTVTRIALAEFQRIRITSPRTNDAVLSIATLLSNQFANRYVAVPRPGVLTWSGSFIAAKVRSMDDTRLTLEETGDGLTLTRFNTTAIFFQALSLHHAHRLRGVNPGVLLRNGDFVEGRVRSIMNGRVTVASLLFGVRVFDTKDEAMAVWLQKPLPKTTRFSIQTASGSRFLVPELDVEQNAIVLNSSPFHRYRIALDEELEISRQSGTNILQLAWARLDSASDQEREALLSKIEIPDLEREAAEANLVRARNIWDDSRRVWTNKKRDYNRARTEAAEAVSQAQAHQRVVAAAQQALQMASRELNVKKTEARTADQAWQAIQLKLKSADQEEERKRLEQEVFLASSALEKAQRQRSRAQEQLERATDQHKKALKASRQASAKAQDLAKLETVARQEYEAAQKETDAAKAAFDLAMSRLL